MATLKIPDTCKIERCVSSDDTKTLGHPNLRTFADGERVVIATDAVKMVVIPVDTDAVDGVIPMEVVKAARRSHVEIDLEQSTATVAEDEHHETWKRSEGPYPDCEAIMARAAVPGAPGTHTFAVNARHLLALQKAMGTLTLVITVDTSDARAPIYVAPWGMCGSVGARGAVMPMNISKDES